MKGDIQTKTITYYLNITYLKLMVLLDALQTLGETSTISDKDTIIIIEFTNEYLQI